MLLYNTGCFKLKCYSRAVSNKERVIMERKRYFLIRYNLWDPRHVSKKKHVCLWLNWHLKSRKLNMQIVSNKKKYVVLYIPNYLLNLYIRMGTLRSLVSVLFYQTTWSEFYQKVSIKKTRSISEKIHHTVLFQGCQGKFLISIKRSGLDICTKSLLNDQYYLFQILGA